MQSGFARDFTEFFFYASMFRKEANDFDRPNSSWAIFLADEKGHRTAPLEVRKIEKITPLIEEFFPFINQYYGICYRLKFPPQRTLKLFLETTVSLCHRLSFFSG